MAETGSGPASSRTGEPAAGTRSHPVARRRIWRRIADFLGGLPLFVTAPLYRHWHMRWGATDDEVRAKMPGDEIVANGGYGPHQPR
jgi:hypothetical protein